MDYAQRITLKSFTSKNLFIFNVHCKILYFSFFRCKFNVNYSVFKLNLNRILSKFRVLSIQLRGEKIKEQIAFALCDTALVYCVHSQSKLLIEMNWSDFKWLHITCAVYSASERCEQLNRVN
jgi:hypothetical protein